MAHTDKHPMDQTIENRRREMAIEHLLFGTLGFLARRHPELLDELEASLTHLWDKADDGSRDDQAVRDVAHTFIRSLRTEIR